MRSGATNRFPQWKVQLAEWAESLGVNIQDIAGIWTKDMTGTGILPLSERATAISDLVATEKFLTVCDFSHRDLGTVKALPFPTKKQMLKGVFCDISQNPKYRSCTSSEGFTGCLATSTMLYSYGKDRVVLPFELVLFQGHRRGIRFPTNMKPSKIRDLAGEGMSLPCLGSIIWAAYLLKGLP